MHTKKLYRSNKNRIIAGVLGGLAEYYDHDPLLWRLGAVVLLIATGLMPGVLVYFIAAILMPLRPSVEYTVHESR